MRRLTSASLSLCLCIAALAAAPARAAGLNEPEAGDRSLALQFGEGLAGTTQTLATSLTDAVAGTVDVAASKTLQLAGSVTAIAREAASGTLSGTVDAAGKVGGAVAEGVRHTVKGTARVAGQVGVVVAETVQNTAFGTVRAASTVTGVVIGAAGTTVNGAVRVADAVGTIVAGTIEDTARSLAKVPMGLLDYATSLIGTPYKWGGTEADEGLDCSGFVLDVVKKSSSPVELPRTARDMSRHGEKVDKAELMPGDLVFFNTRRRPFSHVGIYLGDGAFVHAASGRKSGRQVRIDQLSNRYYTKRYNGARRLAELKLD